jgi:hypothetical protein
MPKTADELISEMKEDVEVWLSGKEVDLDAKYRAAIDATGPILFMAEIFRRFGDTTLSGWLIRLIFVWRDLPFAAWKQVLYRVSNDTSAVYQFIPFVTEYLAIDIVRIIHEDPSVDGTARTFADARFPRGGPAPGSEWVRDILADHGVDQHLLWRRFAAEGAPMKLNPGEIR